MNTGLSPTRLPQKNFLVVSISSLFFLILAGCVSERHAMEQSGSEEQTVAEPAARLPSTRVTVCWHVPGQPRAVPIGPPIASAVPFSARQKRWVQDVLEKEYTPQKTKIHFIGFAECPHPDDTPSSVVRVARARADLSFAVSGGIGDATLVREIDEVAAMVHAPENFDPDRVVGVQEIERGIKITPPTFIHRYIREPGRRKMMIFGFDAYCKGIPKLDEETCVKMVTLHEFGHIAGLRHEHIRPEAADDPRCEPLKDLFEGGSFSIEKLSHSSHVFGLPYDPDSIMNYCYLDYLKSSGSVTAETVSLSSSDRRVLQLLYAEGDLAE